MTHELFLKRSRKRKRDLTLGLLRRIVDALEKQQKTITIDGEKYVLVGRKSP